MPRQQTFPDQHITLTQPLPTEDFPPLPPPLQPVQCSVPRYVNVKRNVSKLVRPVTVPLVPPTIHIVPSHVPCSVPRRVPCSVRPRPMSNHTQPLRRLNKVKPPKYEKCDYVHLPFSPVTVSVPRLVPSPIIHRRHRRRNRRYRNRSVNVPVKCNVNRPITPPSSTSAPPPYLPPHPSLSPSSIPPPSSVPPPSSSFAPPPSPTTASPPSRPPHPSLSPSSAPPPSPSSAPPPRAIPHRIIFCLFFNIFISLYNLFHGIFFKKFFNIFVFHFLKKLFWLLFVILYIFIYFLYKSLKYLYKIILVLIFVYISVTVINVTVVTDVNSNVIFVNSASNNNLKDFNKFNKDLFYKPNIIYRILYFHNYNRDFNYLTELSPPQSNVTDDNYNNGSNFMTIFFILFFSWLKIKNRSSLNFIFALIAILFLVFNSPLKITSINKDLYLCSKSDFFTTESVNVCNFISKAYLRNNLNFFTFSKLKYKNNPLFLKHILLLSGDVSLNPGPSQIPQLNSETWSPFRKRGLHFLHLNINSILPKIDELRNIAKTSKVSVIGISETKLDDTVTNNEINIEGYSILRHDRNRQGGGVACYVRNDISFNQVYIFSNETENIFFEIFLPNSHTITVGIFYRPPNQSKFLDNITNDFTKLNTEKKRDHNFR